MTFFARAGREPHDPPEPDPAPMRLPEWFGPPTGVVPGSSTQRAVLCRTDRVILVVGGFDVYPTGLEFTIDLRLRTDPETMMFDIPFELHARPGRRPMTDPLPDEFLRLGFEFSDGSIWTNFTPVDLRPDRDPPDRVIIGRGGGGGSDGWRMRYWMWPLPPEGDLTVFAEWPLFDVAETSAVLDATAIRRAVADAEVIWD